MNPSEPVSLVPTDKPRGSHLYLRTYTARRLGMVLSAIAVGFTLQEQPFNPMHWWLMALCAVVWPIVAYRLARRSRNPLRTEHFNLWFDCVIAGLWVVLLHFKLLPSLLLLLSTLLNHTMVGGLRQLWLGLLGHATGLLLALAIWGLHWQPETTLLTELGCLPLLFGYPLLMANMMFRQTILLKAQQRQLKYLSEHDALSQVYNRRYFDQTLLRAFQQFLRHPRPLTLLICDVDDFKQVNDRHGHAMGDEVIRQVAAALQHCARSGDVVARLGGDEFVVLLSDTHMQDAGPYARRVQSELDRCFGSRFEVQLSFGAAMARADLRSHEHWLERADAALYRSKHSPRGGPSFSDDTLSSTLIPTPTAP